MGQQGSISKAARDSDALQVPAANMDAKRFQEQLKELDAAFAAFIETASRAEMEQLKPGLCQWIELSVRRPSFSQHCARSLREGRS